MKRKRGKTKVGKTIKSDKPISKTPSGASRSLRPKGNLIFVSSSKVFELEPRKISCDLVGHKTYGLLSIPGSWTLPFFGISADLYAQYATKLENRKKLLADWVKLVRDAATRVGILATDRILVRSSGCTEEINRRGRFHSNQGTMENIQDVLDKCLEKLAEDTDIKGERIPLMVQKECQPERSKGHLSNERRCYEENRDWIGEYESSASTPFQINLRRWRTDVAKSTRDPLSCQLSAHISEVLKIPADWAYRLGARVHYEWVWNGQAVYLVQADEELNWEGHDPVKEHKSRNYSSINFSPRCVKLVTEADAAKFSKIRNVFVYLKLKLPTAPLYILDDRKIIENLSEGVVSDDLREDITELVKGSLVIRTDIETSDLHERQLLPRTQEMKDAASAIEWLVAQSKILTKSNHVTAFIFHNFIPALSAAFAYADPKEPLVQIESLWGLPEGLYYNSHDKYVVDTVCKDIDLVKEGDVSGFDVQEKCNYKHYFVSTTPSGKWETLSLKPPFDWRGSLSFADARRIAHESRRIAKAENQPVSIMWFIGIPESIAGISSIPWYHEAFDIAKSRHTLATRKKTAFDKYYIIRSTKDVDDLKSGSKANTGDRIRIQPTEESLLRDKNTLRKIGEIAKAAQAIIVLEGAVLSHAYYQLLATGAIVEVVHPFIGFEERHGFNKLVRDKIPDIIRERGETATTAILDNEAVFRALREKLVEESCELLDAKDLQSVKAELADVREVLDTIVQRLNISEEEIKAEQNLKRESRGGFSKGIVLVETEKTPPSSKKSTAGENDLSGLGSTGESDKPLNEVEFRRRSETIERRTDRRQTVGRLEVKTSVVVPITRSSSWVSDTGTETIIATDTKNISGQMRGSRIGGQLSVEMTVSIDTAQLELGLGKTSRKLVSKKK